MAEQRHPEATAPHRTGFPGTLRIGSRGPEVAKLRNSLYLAPSELFDEATEAAVKNAQRTNGLPVDGVVDPQTWAVLGL